MDGEIDVSANLQRLWKQFSWLSYLPDETELGYLAERASLHAGQGRMAEEHLHYLRNMISFAAQRNHASVIRTILGSLSSEEHVRDVLMFDNITPLHVASVFGSNHSIKAMLTGLDVELLVDMLMAEAASKTAEECASDRGGDNMSNQLLSFIRPIALKQLEEKRKLLMTQKKLQDKLEGLNEQHHDLTLIVRDHEESLKDQAALISELSESDRAGKEQIENQSQQIESLNQQVQEANKQNINFRRQIDDLREELRQVKETAREQEESRRIVSNERQKATIKTNDDIKVLGGKLRETELKVNAIFRRDSHICWGAFRVDCPNQCCNGNSGIAVPTGEEPQDPVAPVR